MKTKTMHQKPSSSHANSNTAEYPSDMLLVATCTDIAEAHLYKGVLEQADIFCFIQGEQHRSLLGNMFGSYITLGLMVPAQHEDKAIDILNSTQTLLGSDNTSESLEP